MAVACCSRHSNVSDPPHTLEAIIETPGGAHGGGGEGGGGDGGGGDGGGNGGGDGGGDRCVSVHVHLM